MNKRLEIQSYRAIVRLAGSDHLIKSVVPALEMLIMPPLVPSALPIEFQRGKSMIEILRLPY
jgi:hypothetical protein